MSGAPYLSVPWSDDLLIPAAPRYAAISILLPCLFGWAIQFYLSAWTTDRSIRVLRRRNRHKLAMTPLTRPLLLAAAAGNFLIGISCIANLGIYLLSQDRSTHFLESYKWPDAFGPICGITTATATQVFMALRCWKITNKNKVVGSVMASTILVGFGGACWASVVLVMLVLEKWPTSKLFYPTLLYLLGNILADITITIIFTVHLYRMKAVAKQSKTGSFAASLIRLAFESCAIVTFVTILTAILRGVVSRRSALLSHIGTATLNWIPSLYVLSFMYIIEGTAARKRQLERERRSVENGRAFIVNNRNLPSSSGGTGSSEREKGRPLYSWEPPILWQSTVGEPESSPSLDPRSAPFAAYRKNSAEDGDDGEEGPAYAEDIALAEAAQRRPRLSRPSFNFALSASSSSGPLNRERKPSQVTVQVDTVRTSHPVVDAEYTIDFPRVSSPMDLSALDRLSPNESAREDRRKRVQSEESVLEQDKCNTT